jgi:hypothetical protein
MSGAGDIGGEAVGGVVADAVGLDEQPDMKVNMPRTITEAANNPKTAFFMGYYLLIRANGNPKS